MLTNASRSGCERFQVLVNSGAKDDYQRVEEVRITMMKLEKLFVSGESSEVEQEIDEATAYYLGENSIEEPLTPGDEGKKD
jgi:hypothetical protein